MKEFVTKHYKLIALLLLVAITVVSPFIAVLSVDATVHGDVTSPAINYADEDPSNFKPSAIRNNKLPTINETDTGHIASIKYHQDYEEHISDAPFRDLDLDLVDSRTEIGVRLTSYEESQNSDFDDKSIQMTMKGAYAEISTKPVRALCEDLTSELAREISGNDTFDSSNLCITYFFDLWIDASNKYWIDLYEECYLEVVFQLNVPKGNHAPAILYRCNDTDGWELNTSGVVNDDGSVTVRFYKLCPIIIVETTEEVVEPESWSDTWKVLDKGTGCDSLNLSWLWLICLILVVIAVLLMVVMLIFHGNDDDIGPVYVAPPPYQPQPPEEPMDSVTPVATIVPTEENERDSVTEEVSASVATKTETVATKKPSPTPVSIWDSEQPESKVAPTAEPESAQAAQSYASVVTPTSISVPTPTPVPYQPIWAVAVVDEPKPNASVNDRQPNAYVVPPIFGTPNIYYPNMYYNYLNSIYGNPMYMHNGVGNGRVVNSKYADSDSTSKNFVDSSAIYDETANAERDAESTQPLNNDDENKKTVEANDIVYDEYDKIISDSINSINKSMSASSNKNIAKKASTRNKVKGASDSSKTATKTVTKTAKTSGPKIEGTQSKKAIPTVRRESSSSVSSSRISTVITIPICPLYKLPKVESEEKANELLAAEIKKIMSEQKPESGVKLVPTFKQSFISRLAVADSYTISAYSKIKNYLDSYDEAIEEMRWSAETYKFGNKSLAKLKVSNRTLCITVNYVLDDHEDYEYETHNATRTDTTVKLVDGDALRYAKTLVTRRAKVLGLKRSEAPKIRYFAPKFSVYGYYKADFLKLAFRKIKKN